MDQFKSYSKFYWCQHLTKQYVGMHTFPQVPENILSLDFTIKYILAKRKLAQ